LLRRRAATDRNSAIAATVDTFRLIGSKGYAFDEEHLRDVAGRSYDRSYDPHGYLRQLAAVGSQPNRTRQLRRIRVPALVIHGFGDRLVSVSGGLAIARAIQGAKFVGYRGMGHDLPHALWPEFAAEIAHLSARDRATTPVAV
ncbi:MAG: alpha/beta fold hydrolase, partial [Frankiaceae bacterium]